MSVVGRWRIVEMPDYTDDYPDMVEPAYIQFEASGSGAFAFGCVTGGIWGAGVADHVEFSWTGNEEMDEAGGNGWAELRTDGSLRGEICFDRGDEVAFSARRDPSSAAG
jgi:hypothetical protein